MPLLVIELIRQAGYEYSSWQYWAWVLIFIFANIAYDWAVKNEPYRGHPPYGDEIVKNRVEQ